MKRVKIVDLFAGIGGLRLGFEQAASKFDLKTDCVLSSEIDSRAQETYFANFGEKPEGDIRSVIPPKKCDFLLAGFPCQPFSYAGKKMGLGDTRGTLFFEIERILAKTKPNGFLLENVRGLTSHDSGRTIETIIQALEKLGYGVKYLLLNSCLFGVPQNRMRVYIAGIKGAKPEFSLISDNGPADSHVFKADNRQTNLFGNGETVKLVKEILEKRPAKKYKCTDEFIEKLLVAVDNDFQKLHGVRLIDYRGGNSLHSWDLGIKGHCSKTERRFMNQLISNRRKKVFGTHQDGKKLTIQQIKTFYKAPDIEKTIASLISKGYLREVEEKYDPVCGNMSFEVFKFLDPESISITLTSSDAHKLGVVQGKTIRRLTPRECARLQGFPESFQPHSTDTHAYKQFGNSVSVPVVERVLDDLFMNNKEKLSFIA